MLFLSEKSKLVHIHKQNISVWVYNELVCTAPYNIKILSMRYSNKINTFVMYRTKIIHNSYFTGNGICLCYLFGHA